MSAQGIAPVIRGAESRFVIPIQAAAGHVRNLMNAKQSGGDFQRRTEKGLGGPRRAEDTQTDGLEADKYSPLSAVNWFKATRRCGSDGSSHPSTRRGAAAVDRPTCCRPTEILSTDATSCHPQCVLIGNAAGLEPVVQLKLSSRCNVAIRLSSNFKENKS